MTSRPDPLRLRVVDVLAVLFVLALLWWAVTGIRELALEGLTP